MDFHLHSLENGNYCYNPSNKLPVDTWSSIDISQYYNVNTTSYVYRVKVQGEVIGSVVNTAAQVSQPYLYWGAESTLRVLKLREN